MDPSERQNQQGEVLHELEALRDSVTRGVEQQLAVVNERFGAQQEIDRRLAYHCIPHTKDEIRRSELITNVVREVSGDNVITAREAAIIPLIAATHDTVQDFDIIEGKFEGRPTLERKRRVGANETASADELEAFMKKENESHAEGEIYTEDDIETGKRAILATVPEWDAELGTMVQPNKAKYPHPVADVIALADVGGPGIDGAQAGATDDDLLFVEENADVGRMLLGDEQLDQQTLEWLKKRYIKRKEGQLSFIKGRQKLLDTELANFPPEVQTALKDRVFTKFPEALAAAEQALAERREMPAGEVIELVKRTVLEHITSANESKAP